MLYASALLANESIEEDADTKDFPHIDASEELYNNSSVTINNYSYICVKDFTEISTKNSMNRLGCLPCKGGRIKLQPISRKQEGPGAILSKNSGPKENKKKTVLGKISQKSANPNFFNEENNTESTSDMHHASTSGLLNKSKAEKDNDESIKTRSVNNSLVEKIVSPKNEDVKTKELVLAKGDSVLINEMENGYYKKIVKITNELVLITQVQSFVIKVTKKISGNQKNLSRKLKNLSKNFAMLAIPFSYMREFADIEPQRLLQELLDLIRIDEDEIKLNITSKTLSDNLSEKKNFF